MIFVSSRLVQVFELFSLTESFFGSFFTNSDIFSRSLSFSVLLLLFVFFKSCTRDAYYIRIGVARNCLPGRAWGQRLAVQHDKGGAGREPRGTRPTLARAARQRGSREGPTGDTGARGSGHQKAPGGTRGHQGGPGGCRDRRGTQGPLVHDLCVCASQRFRIAAIICRSIASGGKTGLGEDWFGGFGSLDQRTCADPPCGSCPVFDSPAPFTSEAKRLPSANA